MDIQNNIEAKLKMYEDMLASGELSEAQADRIIEQLDIELQHLTDFLERELQTINKNTEDNEGNT